MYEMNTIDKINYYLAKQGKNGAGLCAYLGVSSGVYSQWNTGRTSPRKSKLPLIAEYLGVTVEDLLADEGIKKEPSVPKDEELDKNDDLWKKREAIMQMLPNLDAQQLTGIINYVESTSGSADSRYSELIRLASMMNSEKYQAVLTLLKELL